MGLESLYDKYRLNNSSQIPQYVGSTGDAAIKVATLKQGMYDTAQTGAGEIASMSQNAISMQNQNDINLKNGLVAKVQGNINDWSGKGDWENNVEPVRALGREYIQRARELAAPVEQYNTWVKDELTNEKKGLTPDQIATKQAMALAGYKGLKKDPTGKFVGSFNGGQVADNIDVNKFVDDAMQGAVYNIGGSETSNDNGVWKYKKAGTWNTFSNKEVTTILDNARNGSDKFKGYARQEGEMHAFKQSPYVGKLEDLADAPKARATELINNGIDAKSAVGIALQESRVGSITKTMNQYGIAKYAHDNRTSSTESAIGDLTKARTLKADDEKTLGAQLVETPLDNPAKSWDDLEKSTSDANNAKGVASQKIDQLKSIAGQSYDEVNGKGSFAKLGPTAQENQLQSYYKTKDPAGSSKLAELSLARASYASEDKKLLNIKGAKDMVESYALKEMGTSKELMSNRVKTGVSDILAKMGNENVNVFVGGQGGVRQAMSAAQLKTLLVDAKVEEGGKSNTVLPGFLNQNFQNFTLKDGRKITLSDNAVTGKLDSQISDNAAFGNRLEAKKKEIASNALTNYSQSTMGVVSANKKFNEESRSVLMAGAKVLYDATGNEIKAGTDDEKKLQARISAGQFTLINHQVETKGQNSMMVVAVKDPDDPKAPPQIVRVGTNTTTPGYFGKILMKESQDKDGNITNQSLYDAGSAMQDGSAYKSMINQKIGTTTEVKQYAGKDAQGKPVWKSILKVDKGPNKTVTLTDEGGNPVIGPSGAPLHLEGQARIGAYLDKFKNNPSFKIE